MFDYDRDIMQPPEEREELDPSEYVDIGCGRRRYVGDEIRLKNYLQKSIIGELSICILAERWGQIINEQQDIILKLQNENRHLKRENWNLKKTKGRKK